MATYQDPLFSLGVKYTRSSGATVTRTLSAINAKADDSDENADGYTATQLEAFARAYALAAGGTFVSASRTASQGIEAS